MSIQPLGDRVLLGVITWGVGEEPGPAKGCQLIPWLL